MIKLRVYAKLNLALNVLSCEQEGYHQLDMVNQSISLFDEIRIVPRPDERISVHCDKDIGVINTAWTSASEFAKKFNTTGCDITIKKGIPMKGGLGGSSADAAGVLVALAKWHKIPLEQVYSIADAVGSDVKYMMTGGLARVRGKGEQVQTIESDSLVYFVVVMPQLVFLHARFLKLSIKIRTLTLPTTMNSLKPLKTKNCHKFAITCAMGCNRRHLKSSQNLKKFLTQQANLAKFA